MKALYGLYGDGQSAQHVVATPAAEPIATGRAGQHVAPDRLAHLREQAQARRRAACGRGNRRQAERVSRARGGRSSESRSPRMTTRRLAAILAADAVSLLAAVVLFTFVIVFARRELFSWRAAARFARAGNTSMEIIARATVVFAVLLLLTRGLRALEAVDDGAHGKERPRRQAASRSGDTRANHGSERRRLCSCRHSRMRSW